MVADGLFDEVKGLLDSGLSPDCTAMQAIGYKEPAAYFKGEMTKDEATELIKLSSRRYAKRQLTWLRRDETVNGTNGRPRPILMKRDGFRPNICTRVVYDALVPARDNLHKQEHERCKRHRIFRTHSSISFAARR